MFFNGYYFLASIALLELVEAVKKFAKHMSRNFSFFAKICPTVLHIWILWIIVWDRQKGLFVLALFVEIT